MRQEPLLQAKEVDKIYPVGGHDFYALKNLSFTLNRGEFAGLIGPSGSGKTTLLNLLGALDTPNRGTIELLGEKLSHLSANKQALFRRLHISFIFQTYNLLPLYSVFENVELPLILLKLEPKERKKRVHEALEWLSLMDKAQAKPSQLSGGQAQRVAIARAMVKNPEIILADEPTANLDSEASHGILKTLRQINEEKGATFLFSTHDDKVIGYLKRKITLTDGQIVHDLSLPEPLKKR